MSHYEARLQRDLDRILTDLTTISTRVQDALKDGVHALLSSNRKQAYDCILGDLPINRAVRRLDKTCHGFIALHLPSAGHLRWISAVMRTNTALERIGDYAVTVCRESVQLPKAPDGILAREFELMAKESSQMLHQAMDAFAEQNAEAAKATMVMADQVERTFDTVVEELTGGNGQWSKRDIFALLVIFHMLERVSDQAKNICEETVFAAIGETKTPKTYRVLFLDQDNAGLSKMTEALGRKGFPDRMSFSSAGRTAADAFDPVMAQLMAKRGIDLADETPGTLAPVKGELDEYHVIVSLSGAVTDYIEQVPFHTVASTWETESPPAPDAPDAIERWEAIQRDLAIHLRDLVQLLHGEEVE